jgi:hypothetical protein
VLKNSVDRKEFAGVNVAIARQGKLAYFESFGFQDLEARKPMRPETIFRMASMTKPIDIKHAAVKVFLRGSSCRSRACPAFREPGGIP